MVDNTDLARRRAEHRLAFRRGAAYAETHEHCPCLGALMRAYDWRYDQALHFAQGFQDTKRAQGDPFVIKHFGCCHPSSDRNVPPNPLQGDIM